MNDFIEMKRSETTLEGTEPIYERVCKAFNNLVRLNRETIMEGALPSFRHQLSILPRLGTIGKNYRPSGVALIGINPGNGEGRSEIEFEVRDKLLVTAFDDFKRNPDFENLNNLMEAELRDMEFWHLDWAISGTLERLNLCMEDIAFTNVIPFSTRRSSDIKTGEWIKAVDQYLSIWLASVDPGLVIWLGKIAYDKTQKYLHAANFKSIVVDRRLNWSFEERFHDLESYLVQGCESSRHGTH